MKADSWDVRHPAILNLHFFSRDSYISGSMSGRTLSGWYQKASESAEDRGPDADTHLALLGVKIAGTGILGYTKDFTKEFLRKF